MTEKSEGQTGHIGWINDILHSRRVWGGAIVIGAGTILVEEIFRHHRKKTTGRELSPATRSLLEAESEGIHDIKKLQEFFNSRGYTGPLDNHIRSLIPDTEITEDEALEIMSNAVVDFSKSGSDTVDLRRLYGVLNSAKVIEARRGGNSEFHEEVERIILGSYSLIRKQLAEKGYKLRSEKFDKSAIDQSLSIYNKDELVGQLGYNILAGLDIKTTDFSRFSQEDIKRLSVGVGSKKDFKGRTLVFKEFTSRRGYREGLGASFFGLMDFANETGIDSVVGVSMLPVSIIGGNPRRGKSFFDWNAFDSNGIPQNPDRLLLTMFAEPNMSFAISPNFTIVRPAAFVVLDHLRYCAKGGEQRLYGA